MPYTIFIINASKWTRYADYVNLSSAKQEVAYLATCGVKANVFTKKAA